MPHDGKYTVVSSDCHGGASMEEYRDYLDPSYRDEFDGWAASYEVPYDDLKGEEGSRNWDSERRLREMESDGVVAEVMFPNTIPPFFPTSSLASSQAAITDSAEFSRRWAGLRAHNRWLVDFCADSGGRRAGVFQILLHDIDEAVKEVEWAVSSGLRGGLLLPGVPPGSGLPPIYYHEHYAPLWSLCAEHGIPVNCHSGSSGPRTGDRPEDDMFFLLEMKWWDQRTLRHFILGGVLERHPGLQVVITEAGVSWIPAELRAMDAIFKSMRSERDEQAVNYHGPQALGGRALLPSEYWRRQCYAGASFIHPSEVAISKSVGVDRIMWGSDYPHNESSFPYSREAIAFSFAGVSPADTEQMLGGNAARLYGFSSELLGSAGSLAGPGRGETFEGIDPATLPAEAAKCPAFAGAMAGCGTMQMDDNRKARPGQPAQAQ
jgi:predicted TIM-barrel fold metal-dependent hydrolase